jgi:hypothetical protein
MSAGRKLVSHLVGMICGGVVIVLAGGRPSLPNGLGQHLRLDKPQVEIERIYDVKATRCASCTAGEQMADLDGRAAMDIRADLEDIGLFLGVKSRAESYFVEGRLQTIVVSGLDGSAGLEALVERYGKAVAVQDTQELSEYEWIDGNVRLRLGRVDGSYELILSVHH